MHFVDRRTDSVMDNDFSTQPPSYDDVIAAGPSMFVGGGRMARPLPFTMTPPPASSSFTMQTVAEHPTPPSNRQASSSTLPVTNSAPPRGGVTRTPRVSTTNNERAAPNRVPNNPRQPGRTSAQHPRQSLPTVHERQQKTFVDQIALFSMPNLMLTGLTLPKIDVDLDTEAHLPNRRKAVKQARTISRIKFCCGCFWFFGFVLLFLLIALPVAMILTALFGMNDCPYSSNIFVSSLITLGVLLAVSVILRLVISALTCCKIADIGGWEKSAKFSLCIVVMEVIFLFILVVFLLLMLSATWFVFAVTPRETPSQEGANDYCTKGFHTAASTFVGSNLTLAVFVMLYLSVLSVFYVFSREYLSTSRTKSTRRAGRGHV